MQGADASQGQERHRVSDGDRLMDGLWSAARFSFCTTKLHAIFQPSIKSAMPTALLGDSWEIRKELEREVLGLQTDGKVTEKSGAAEQNNRGRATTGNSREALLRGLQSHTIYIWKDGKRVENWITLETAPFYQYQIVMNLPNLFRRAAVVRQ